MEASSLDDHRAEPSYQVLRDGRPLDVERAKLSLEHVRALNTQFASWVQSQLQNHLDELWIDGVKDYLSHASNILDEFKDIVDWLRGSASELQRILSTSLPRQGNTDSTPNIHSANVVIPPGLSLLNSVSKLTPVSPNNQGDSVFVSKNTESNTSSFTDFSSSAFCMPPNVSKMATSANLQLSQSSSFFPNSLSGGFLSTSVTTSSVFSSIQNSTQQKVEMSGDADEDGELEQPYSPSVKKVEEKGVSIVHEVKCKVYMKDELADCRWKDMGAGNLSIKCREGSEKATRESKPTIICRNDAGRILLNALIYPGIKMNIQKTSIVSIFHTSGGEDNSSSEVVSRAYLLRLKSLEDTAKLAEVIKEYAPSA